MKVIIVGCGRVGARLAKQLDAEGHQVTVVDQLVSAFNRLGRDFGGNMIVGNCIDEAVLRRAGVEKADCFVSVTNGDNRNLMAAQIAQRFFKVPRVITRLYDPIRRIGVSGDGAGDLLSDLPGGGPGSRVLPHGVNHGHGTAGDPRRWAAS